MKAIRAAVRRMLAMCPAAWYILIRCLQLSCVLLLGAVLFLIRWDGDDLCAFSFYRHAVSLQEIAQTILLAAVIVPVCVEDLKGQAP